MRHDLCATRALDALHLATAVELPDEEFGTEIVIATLDGPMRLMARKLEFKVLS